MVQQKLRISYNFKIVLLKIFAENIKFIFGIKRFITNQQNIYRVTSVYYLQKAEKKT